MIGVCGFGYSGSGAVLDLLKEYEEVQVLDNIEFYITYFPDGLCDLYEHLCVSYSRFFDGDVSVKRFLELTQKMGSKKQYKSIYGRDFAIVSREYVMSLINTSWEGFWAYDWYYAKFIERNLFFRLGIRVNKLFKCRIFKSKKIMYLCIEPELFIEKSRKYIKKLLSYSKIEIGKLLVLNQCFPANDPVKCYKYFENPKAIIVIRDPRDVYLLAKKVVRDDASWIPTESVEKFIEFYKKQYKNIKLDRSILTVRFEDLIYKYEETVNTIEQFAGIRNHIEKKRFFDPQISVRNTQLFYQYPEHGNDIKKIESELNEYLYPFDRKSRIIANTDIF